MKNFIAYVFWTLSALTLTACDTNNSITGDDITGFLSKGPVTGATCNVFKVNAAGIAESTALGTAKSSSGSVDFGAITYTGTALISCTLGTYTDEASGITGVSAPDMSAVVTMSAGGNYVISPLTEIGYRLAGANLETAVTTHNDNVADQFGLSGIDITTEQPTDLNENIASDDNAGAYGTALAAISQLVGDGTEGATLEAVITALESDLADGTVDETTQENIANAASGLATSEVAGNVNTDATNSIISNLVSAPSLADSTQAYLYNSVISTLNLSNSGGGVLSSCTTSPALPAGLSLAVSSDNATCELTGTPTTAQSSAIYAITATNATGSNTGDLSISIDKAEQVAFDAGADIDKTYGDSAFTRIETGGSGTGSTTFTSSDLNVATVAPNTGGIVIIGVGTTTVTMTNAGDNNHNTATDNYDIVVVPKNITVTAIPRAKVYGEADDIAPYTHDGNGLINSDSLSGNLAREAGENAGTYDVTGTLTHDNYIITFDGADKFSITPKDITVTVQAKSKAYGSTDPELTYGVNPSLIAQDVLSGALTRVDEGGSIDGVGQYAITQGTLANSNYNIDSFVGSTLTIVHKTIAVTANAGQSKVYGDSDPVFAYTVGSVNGGLVGSDTLSGSLSRVDAGGAIDSVGDYAISEGTLDSASLNYNIAFYSSDLAITPKLILVTLDNESKVYGESNPVFEHDNNGVIGGDILANTLTSSGVIVGDYDVTGTLTHDNYIITFDGTDKFSITAKPISVTADSGKTKVFDTADPEFTYTLTSGTLEPGDSLSGSLSRDAGPNVGTYTIDGIGTLAIAPNPSNYVIGVIGGTFIITKAAQAAINAGSDISTTIGDAPYTQPATGGTSSADITYSSDNETVATVNPNTGEVTLVGVGSTAITASRDQDINYNYVEGHYGITVRPQAPSNLIATPTGGLVGIDGDKVSFTWDAPAVGGANSYTVYATTVSMAASTNADASTLIVYSAQASNTGSALTEVVSAHPNGNKYYYLITTIKNGVESLTSIAEASATPFATVVSPDTGKTWMSRNLGATQDCTASNDIACYGDLYQWGRDSDGHERISRDSGACINSSNNTPEACSTLTTALLVNINTPPHSDFVTSASDWKDAVSDVSGAERSAFLSSSDGVCPIGFRIPTEAEFAADTTGATNAVINSATAFSSFLKLPVAGFRSRVDGVLGDVDTNAYYWNSAPTGNNSFYFTPANAQFGTHDRAHGLSLRCVQSVSTIVDPYITGAILFEDLDGNGQYDSGELLSSASNAKGEFSFSGVLTPGKTILIKDQGLHEGKAYDVVLEAIVDANGNVDVVTPLTTFTSKGLSNQQLADILNLAATAEGITIGGSPWVITASDVSQNPLEGGLLNATLTDIQGNEALLKKLQASLTTYGMLKIFKGSTTLQGMDGAALYASGHTDPNGAVALLAKNMLSGVTDSLNQTLLTSVETQLVSLRAALTQGGVPNVGAIAPEVNVDLISKIAVSAIDRLAEVGYNACNNEQGNVTAKVTAALTAVGSAVGNVDAQIMQLATNLYGMKYASSLGDQQIMGGLAGAQQQGNASAGYLLEGINAAQAGNATFRFHDITGLISAQ